MKRRMAKKPIEFREDWLRRCADALVPWLDEIGQPVIDPYRVTCGWPAVGALSMKRQRIGECWSAKSSQGGVVEVFISPLLDDPVEVAATVMHELIHAAGLRGHRANFARRARQLGLDGPATMTVAGEAFKRRVETLLSSLGPYPHQKMTPGMREKKQTTRLIKVGCVECEENGEPYIVRMSRATLDRGAPLCPEHYDHPMEETII